MTLTRFRLAPFARQSLIFLSPVATQGCEGRRKGPVASLCTAAGGPTLLRDTPEDAQTTLVNLPPTSRQTWSALAVAAVLVAGFGVLAPYSAKPLARVDAFIPTFEAIVFVTDLITSVLLFAHFSIYRSRALLALASGYLFTALIVIPHALTFPGAFSPTGLLGAGLQSTIWLYFIWHISFPMAVLIYAWLKDENRHRLIAQASALPAICFAVAITIGLVCGFALLATVGGDFLPSLFLDRTHIAPSATYVNAFWLLICGVALAVLWARRSSVLDRWLMVVVLASILEALFVGVLTGARFSLGFYAGRICSLATSTVVLVVLLAETTRLYSRLAHSNMLLRGERNNKLMSLEAMMASIVHEVRQPLAAIRMNGGAASRFLGHARPNLEEARSALTKIGNDVDRIGQVFDGFRSLFGRAEAKRERIDVNQLALGVLRTMRKDLKDHGITTRIELTSEVPFVASDMIQLQQVLINLVNNAVDAMKTIDDDRRVLRVSTAKS